MLRHLLIATTAIALAAPALAGDEPDLKVIARLTDAEMNHGEVMDIAAQLTDRIGGRMTNSPAMRQAEAWTQSKYREWGLSNVHLEPFLFGRGWSIDSIQVRLVGPTPRTLHAIPVAWQPGTGGPVSAPIIVAPIRSRRDLERWRGKLAGKIVLVSLPRTSDEPSEPAFQRLKAEDLAKLDSYEQPQTDDEAAERRLKALGARDLDNFLAAEGAKAWVTKAYRDGDLVSGEGDGYGPTDIRKVPAIQMAAEDYRRLARLAKGPDPVVLEIDSRVTFHDKDLNANNVVAEIPGSDPKAGYVMAGAHLDSWVAGDGAADNGAGSAVVMEAARLLAGLGIRPKRTIRFVLWSGEEQGLLGSLAYTEAHLASRPPETDPERAKYDPYDTWPRRFPITPRAEYNQLAAYFNLDNGSGKIRGVYAEGNPAVVPIFQSWLAPFASMGATAVVANKTGGTDHVFLQSVGLPGFQFVQDPLDYETRVHHSQLDTYDHLRAEDLRQASVIMASFLWNAANRAEPLPRGVLPTKPKDSDRFRYTDPKDLDY